MAVNENCKNRGRCFIMKKLISILASVGILAGCATMPKENFEDKFYTLIFEPLPTGLINEYDTDGDGAGDLRFVYEIIGQDSENAYFELRKIMDDKNRNRVYEKSETTIIPKKTEFVKL